MNDFSMTKYYHEYQEAVIQFGHLDRKRKGLKASLADSLPPMTEEEARGKLAELEALEAECAAAKEVMEKAHYKALRGDERPTAMTRFNISTPGKFTRWPS